MQLVVAVREDLAGQGVPATIYAITNQAGVALTAKYPRATEPSLARWYGGTVGDPQGQQLAAQLRALPEVEQAFVKSDARPPMRPPEDGVQPGPAPVDPTPAYDQLQRYLGSAPDGIAAQAAWDEAGGDGEDIRVIDVELAWELNHEKLAHKNIADDFNSPNPSARNHGTSVLGMLAADHDGRGTKGICPAATIAVQSMRGEEDATDDATYEAVRRLGSGDILLLELERRSGPEDGSSQGYMPVEWWPDEFDVIRSATNKGIIVVEAAGNGSVDLDHPPEDADPGLRGRPNPFRRGDRDSGAIIVGAGARDRSRLGFSNYGSCADAQGWGDEVVTSGGYGDGAGDLCGGDDPTRWYTARFNGTSAAAPMVAGALACVQGVLKAAGLRPLTPAEAREALRGTGSPQTGAAAENERIGNRPDLRALIPLARTIARRPADHQPTTRPRRPAMKITITIEDGVTIDDAGGSVSNTARLSSTNPASVDWPHIKGPTLAIVNNRGLQEEFAEVRQLPSNLIDEIRTASKLAKGSDPEPGAAAV